MWERVLAKRRDTRLAYRRMAQYGPLVRHALASRAVPEDFIFLPVIESDYQTGATSRQGAAGIWQFMPATARAYGLEVSRWVDERRDPVRSTFAAARHLRDLYTELGSWHLAAAAYNCGSPRVARIAAGSRSDAAFWSNRQRLPRETRTYVPKLLAAARMGHRAPWTDPRVAPLQFQEVMVPGGVPLTAVAASLGVSADTLFTLNPHLVRQATPPGRRWPVRIPAPPR